VSVTVNNTEPVADVPLGALLSVIVKVPFCPTVKLPVCDFCIATS
jgi:hypothetical protein